MAKALAFHRSTSQVVTFDTINNLVLALGPALAGVAATTGTFPAKIQNAQAIYRGDPYVMVVTTAGNLEVRKYNVATDTWTLSSGSYAPITLGALQAPICLQIVNGVLVAIWLESAAANSRVSVVTFNGATWSTRQNAPTNALLNGAFGGNSVVWDNAVFFATSIGIGSYVPGTGFGSFDQGFNPAIANPLIDPVTPQGCFAFWNNTLYFIKPSTATSGAILLSLAQDWNISLAPPQWTTVTGVSGIVNTGVMLVGNDLGNYSLFVNRQNQLCLFQSGPNGTNLAVASPSAFPTFTDVTSNLVGSDIASKSNLGISLYVDDRRRLNEQQWIFIRDPSLSGNSVTLIKWDGVNPLDVQTNFPGQDYLLPASQDGEPTTFTNVQPACYITDVNSGPYVTLTLASAVGFAIGDIVQSGSPSIQAIVTNLVGTTLTGKVIIGSWAASGSITDTATSTTTTYSGATSAFVAPAFPGRAVISYIVKDTLSRNVDVFGEYSLDGLEWLTMTQGDGDDGAIALASSPAGTAHTFFWDSFADLDGDYGNLYLRMVARIAISVNEAPINPFVTVIQEGYLRPPVARNVSQLRLNFFSGSLVGSFQVGETVTGNTSGATGFVQHADSTGVVITAVTGTFIAGAPGEIITGSNLPPHQANVGTISGSLVSPVVTTTTIPPDETTDLIEFHQANSTVTRGHAQLIFQGRLSTNQTKLRFLKLTLRASAPTANAKITLFCSGFGAAQQYTGPFSSFLTLPTADTEVIIDATQILNQPSVTGKLYAIQVEFDLDIGQNAVVSTPFFRHE